MGSHPSTDTLSIKNYQNKIINISRSHDVLFVQEQGKRAFELPISQILYSEVRENDTLVLAFLRKYKKHLKFYQLKGTLPQGGRDTAIAWANTLLGAAYESSRPKRRFKVVINPFGGSGRALRIFDRKVKPILEAAKCQYDVLVTERRWHCFEHIKTMSLDYEALMVLSGDGLIHEIFNAFAAREDASEAFAIPVVQIPTGSGNGFSISLLGLEHGLDVRAAVLNAIKGKPMKIDLCVMKQNDKEFISFMSQSIGMMADIDLGTEYMRWMGGTRFMVGYLLAICSNRSCPMKLEIKIASKDKQQMTAAYRNFRQQAQGQSDDNGASPVSPLVHNDEDDDKWTVINKKLAYVCAGKLPYVSKDLMQFPVALCDDGFIDIVAQEKIPRLKWLKAIDGAEKGKPFWDSSTNYFKATSYRLTPSSSAPDGCFSVDGEKFPYTSFEVEVRQRLGTTLGNGAWSSNFTA